MTEQESIAEVFLDAAKNFEQKTLEQEAFVHKIAHKTKWVIRFSNDVYYFHRILNPLSWRSS